MDPNKPIWMLPHPAVWKQICLEAVIVTGFKLCQTLHQLVLISENTELVTENKLLEPPDVAVSPRGLY
jgi:hypothetical protein